MKLGNTPFSVSLRAAFRDDQGHLRVLTGIRGWAALWVFMYHAWGYAKHPDLVLTMAGWSIDLTPFFSMGFAGVTIFFVLSGFLLARPFAQWQAGERARPALGRYLFRRVMRVFPAYYAQLTLLVLIAYWSSGQWPIQDLISWLRHLTMLFVPPPLGGQPVNGVWWTLPIEFSFYLALPFIAFMLRPARALGLLAACLISMYLWRLVVTITYAEATLPERVVAAYQLPGSLDSFGIGMLAALLHVNRDRFPPWLMPSKGRGWLGPLGLILLVTAIYWLPGKRADYWANNLIFYTWTPALSCGVAAMLLAGVQGGRMVNWLFGNRFLFFLGLVSYSLYLWHLPVFQWLAAASWYPALTEGRLVWIMALALPASLAISTLSYLMVEHPFMRLRGFGRR